MDRNALSLLAYHLKFGSLSARRAWIEILFCVGFSSGAKASLSARRAWIEIGSGDYVEYSYKSLSARRAWIEMHPRS